MADEYISLDEVNERAQSDGQRLQSTPNAQAAQRYRTKDAMAARLGYTTPPVAKVDPDPVPGEPVAEPAMTPAEASVDSQLEFLNQQTGMTGGGETMTLPGGATVDQSIVGASPEMLLGRGTEARDPDTQLGQEWLETAVNSFALGQAPVGMGLVGATSEKALRAGLGDTAGGAISETLLGGGQGNRSVLDTPEDMSWADLYSQYKEGARERFNESRRELYDEGGFLAGASADFAGAAPSIAAAGLKMAGGAALKGAGMAVGNITDNAVMNRMATRVNSRLNRGIQALSRVAPAEVIDDWLAKKVSGVGGVGGVLARLGAAAGAAGLTAAAEEGTSTDWDVDELTGASGEAVMWALPLQLMAGEAAAPLIRWLRDDRAAVQLAREFTDRVQTPGGATYDSYREAIDNLKPGDTILDLKVPGTDIDMHSARAINDFVKRTIPDLPSTNPRGSRRLSAQEYGQLWEQAESVVSGAAAGLEQKVNRTWQIATEAPTLSQLLDAEKAARGESGNIISRISSDRIGAGGVAPLGATPVSRSRVRYALSNGALNFGETKLANMESLTPVQRKAFTRIEKMLFPKKGKKKAGDLSISQLYRVRQDLGRMIGAKDTRTIPGEQRAFTVHMIGKIDDLIRDELGGVSDEARRAYSLSKRRETAYMDGQKLFAGRTFDLTRQTTVDLRSDVYGANVEEYLQGIQGDPSRVKAFRDGFANALNQHIGERGFDQTMMALVGPADITGAYSSSRHALGNITMLKQIMGEKETDALLRAYGQDAAKKELWSAFETMEDARRGAVPTETRPGAAERRLPFDEGKIERASRKVGQYLRRAVGTDLDDARQVLRSFTDPLDILKQRLHHGLDLLTGAQPVVGAKAAATEGYEDDRTNPDWLDGLVEREEQFAHTMSQAIERMQVEGAVSQER